MGNNSSGSRRGSVNPGKNGGGSSSSDPHPGKNILRFPSSRFYNVSQAPTLKFRPRDAGVIVIRPTFLRRDVISFLIQKLNLGLWFVVPAVFLLSNSAFVCGSALSHWVGASLDGVGPLQRL